MADQSTLDKIAKAKQKKKTANIIKLMESRHADSQTLCCGLEALAEIADEASVNFITHYLDNPDPAVRIAACKAGIGIGTDYMKTRVRYQLSAEQDPPTKKAIQDAFNAKYN
ncbi:MAG: HEAT repeat domain-containing protein [Lachnospiraceae bacterium]|nr:HEAT repeat domain-containing protein [Lachnospiraceae bacterium]